MVKDGSSPLMPARQKHTPTARWFRVLQAGGFQWASPPQLEGQDLMRYNSFQHLGNYNLEKTN